MKKILLVLSAVVVLIGLVVGIYFLFFSGNNASLTIDNPFDGLEGGDSDATPNQNGLEPGEVLQGAGTEVAPRLIKVTDGPVVPQTVAFTIILPGEPVPQDPNSTTTPVVPTKTDTEIRYIERASGNVYAYVAHERTLTRLGNRTLPGIQEASWLSNGSQAYVRFLSTEAGTDIVESFALPATGEGGYFLEQNLSEVNAFGTNTLVTMLSTQNGSIATVAGADGSAPRTLFNSPLSSLQLSLASTTYVAHTKASSGLDGYVFAVSPTTGAFTTLLGPLRGLTALPSMSGTQVLYSYVTQGSLRTALYDRTSRTSITLPVATLTEKCAWTTDGTALYCAVPRSFGGTLPDDWYQGAISFSDRIWRIDLGARQAILVIDPEESGEVAIDAVGLSIDPALDTVTFVNRKDGSLWVYDL